MTPNGAFFYGTLMLPAVLHRVCHGTSIPEEHQKNLFSARAAILHHHQRHRIKEADYPAVLPCDEPHTCVRGTYVSGLTDEDLWRLDIFEGKEYERRKVNVKILDEECREIEDAEAETYIWIADEDQLEKREWDFDEFVRQKVLNWVASEAQPGYAVRPSYRGIHAISWIHESWVSSDSLNANICLSSSYRSRRGRRIQREKSHGWWVL